jgi:hypothetical protein
MSDAISSLAAGIAEGRFALERISRHEPVNGEIEQRFSELTRVVDLLIEAPDEKPANEARYLARETCCVLSAEYEKHSDNPGSAHYTDGIVDLVRTLVVAHPDWERPISGSLSDALWKVRISPWSHLRAMANLFWSAIRHPLSNTTIDLSTGRVAYRS